jgi:alkylation response protein AidB-like acyl-CoA dehydrogenase
MNFDFSEDQRTIKATARELLASRSPFERVREAAEAQRYDDALWRELCELGWPGIAVGEEHGGQGLGAVELAVLLEELGYAVAATPLLGSALAALAIEHAGSDEQRARWLPALASGEATGAFGRADLVVDAQEAAVIVMVEDGRGRRADRLDRSHTPVRAGPR